jgi:hypothetical protein
MRGLFRDRVTIQKSDGTQLEVPACFTAKQVNFLESDLPDFQLEEGDKIIRTLPNNLQEVYLVQESTYLGGGVGQSAQYKAKIRKERAIKKSISKPSTD